MKILSQLDSRWAQIKMLPSNITIGHAGCTTTSICMLSDYFGCFESPDRVINQNIFYTQDGLILWNKINFPFFGWEKRLYGRNDLEINQSLKDSNKAVILEINHSHWVVALWRIGSLIRVADPWGGTKHFINQSIVTGSSHFKHK